MIVINRDYLLILGLIVSIWLCGNVIIGCTDVYPPSEQFKLDEVPGKYIATFGERKEYIELKSDHTFEHFWNSDSLLRKEEGIWKIKENLPQYPGYFHIILDPIFTDTWNNIPIDSSVVENNKGNLGLSATFKKRKGKLQIVIHPLENLKYVKTELISPHY